MPHSAAMESSIKVLHRSCDGPSSSGSLLEVGQLAEQVDHLKQQLAALEQAKAKATAERKEARQIARQEREQRQAAEQRVRRLLREAESAAAARQRVEGAFGRAMEELRNMRALYLQSQGSIQLLLTELAKAKAALAAARGTSPSSGGSAILPSPRGRSQPGSPRGTAAGSAAAAAAASTSRRATAERSRLRQDDPKPEGAASTVEDLMSELEAARVAADAAESSRAALQQQLSALVEQKERAELSTDMVTRQTQALLEDRQQLLRALEGKDEAVRQLEAQVDHLSHELELAVGDKELLLSHLERVGGQAAVAALGLDAGEPLSNYGYLDGVCEEGLGGLDALGSSSGGSSSRVTPEPPSEDTAAP